VTANSAEGLDGESLAWLRRLGGGDRQAAELELHARLVRAALADVQRRAAGTLVSGREYGDDAQRVADDAMIAILAKLGDFRGESRFITWAYLFVILEVAARAGRPGAGPQRRADCDEAIAILPGYADLTAANGGPAARYPGVAAHLAVCGPCTEDLAGLLQAAVGG
jgi:hypothetical protein